MCEERIEKAANTVEGVETADWNKETKMLNVEVAQNVELKTVHQAIADAGHDTELIKAKNEVYSNLPACCLYRDGDDGHKSNEHEGHNH